MTEDKVKKLLLSRVFRAWQLEASPDRFALQSMTRRKFLVGAGVAGALVATGELGSVAPLINRVGRGIIVSYGDSIWEINPALFGPAAKVQWRRSGDDFFIALSHAFLPGTDFATSFRARLMRRLTGWKIRLSMPGIGFAAEGPLESWVSGATPLLSAATVRKIRLGFGQIDVDGNKVQLLIDRSFYFLLGGSQTTVRMVDPAVCTGTNLSLQPLALGKDDFRGMFSDSDDRPVTSFSIAAPRDGEICRLNSHSPRGIAFEPKRLTNCCGEVGETTSGVTRSVLLIEGNGILGINSPEGEPVAKGRIHLEQAAMLLASHNGEVHAAIGGRVAPTPHALDCGSWIATIAGEEDSPFYARFKDGKPRTVKVRARVENLSLPIDDADIANVTLGGRPVEILIPTGLVQTTAEDIRASRMEQLNQPGSSLIILGHEPVALFPLDESTINIRRGIDLFNLSFGFEGFDLRVRHGTPVLQRRRPKQSGHEWPRACVTAHFPGQHIAEEWFKVQDPKACMPNPPCFPNTSRARLSRPSRLVFNVPGDPKDPKWIERSVSIEDLTDWAELTLSVNSRAKEPEESFENQIKLARIEPETTLEEAVKNVAATLQPPSSRETALEMTGRLLFSPSSSAKWIIPRGPVDASQATLWHARLDPRGRQTVRAIWSSMIIPGHFSKNQSSCSYEDSEKRCREEGNSLLVLTGDDHWMIVAQSSVYGLIALRRLGDPNEQSKEPVARALKNLPCGEVVRPKIPYQCLEEMDRARGYKESDSGFALPSPFTDAQIILTSMGGTLNADWQSEPPLILTDKKRQDGKPTLQVDWPPPLALERFGYRSQISRDIRIDVLKKGYLLPLSIRASYVRVVERRFFRHPQYGYPVAYPVQRTFLVVQKPDKKLPAINQPFESRDFPAELITILTKTTQDLVDPDEIPASPGGVYVGATDVHDNGRVRVNGLPDTVLVFWPRLSRGLPGSPGDVDFKWSVDDDKAPIVSNLLFVENSCLSLEEQMGSVVDYYRALVEADGSWSRLRTARVSGTRRRYAPSKSDGETSYDTDSWLLSARGRILPDKSNSETETFLMDGRMEGGNQPPFYPLIERARVTVQSLDRLVGTPQGLIETAFNPVYVRKGFNSSENRSEIFLNVLGPDIKLDVTSQGSATGGLAKPNTLVAALSRSKGPIGGTRSQSAITSSPKPPVAAHSLTVLDARLSGATAPAGSPTPSSPYDFRSAQQGNFNPSEFLGGVGNAKLLGLISLKDVLSLVDIGGAPQLLEKVGHGVPGATEAKAVSIAQEISQRIGVPLLDSLKSLQSSIEKVFESKPVSFRDLYPSLDARLSAFVQSLSTALPVIKKAKSIAEMAEAISSVATDGAALLSEIGSTLRDPVPPLVQGEIDGLATTWELLKNLANNNYREIGRKLQSEIVGRAITEFCNEVEKSGLGGLLFGIDSDVGCEYIAENPTDALDHIERSLFAQVFAEPLADLLGYLRDYESEVTARIAWAQRTVETVALTSIQVAAEGLRTRLLPPAPNETDHILVESTQRALARAITESLAKIVREAGATAGNAPDADSVRIALDRTDEAIKQSSSSITAVIQQQRKIFKVTVPSEIDGVIQGFVNATVNQIEIAALKAVESETNRIRKILLTRLQETKAAAIERLLGAVERIVRAMSSSALFARVAEAGRAVSQWCDAVAGPTTAKVVVFSDDLASGTLGDLSTMVSNLTVIIQKSDDLHFPVQAPPDLRDKFERAKSAIKIGAQQLALTIQTIGDQRKKLGDVRKAVENGQLGGICGDVKVFLDPVGGLMQLRREAVDRLHDLADQTVIVQSIIGQGTTLVTRGQSGQLRSASLSTFSVLGSALPAASSALDDVVKAVGALLVDLTSIGQAGGTGKWSDVAKGISTLQTNSQLGQIPGYVEQLKTETGELLRLANEYRNLLGAADLDPLKLRAAAEGIAKYAVDNDKKLAALALQSVALTANLYQLLGQRAATVLSDTAKLFAGVHSLASTILGDLVKVLHDPIVALIVNKEVIAKFEAAKQDVDTDLTYLNAIAAAGSNVTTALDTSLKLLNERWKSGQPALARTFSALADLVEHFLRGDLASLINLPDIRTILQSVEDQLVELLKQILPTRADLSYNWQTGLGPVPSGGSPVFFMTEGKSPDDLKIDAHISVDFVTGSRVAIVTGSLKRFTIYLLGKDIDIAQVKFKGASFESRNGSAPQFKADIEDVVLGKLLEFLKPLQAWMSPSDDSGFYVQPVLSPGPGIKAGYTYDAGVIQVGTLQFINVALGVSARLPFGNEPAELEFHFASIDRPFLVAQPPYGGGGYLKLISNSQDITEFGLSIVFGGVVAIHFGPLRAQGRVVAGITIEQSQRKREIVALIEAVGEGNIACFAICVSIKVGLRQTVANGSTSLYGFSVFSFSFKVGFVTFKYSFKAEYTIQSGGQSTNQSQALELNSAELARSKVGCPPRNSCIDPKNKDARRILNKAPRKATAWREYRKRVSMMLLEQ